MNIYVAILEDRHCDPQIEVFQHREKALTQIKEWQADYFDEIWVEEDMEGWEYYVKSECIDDDGPNMRIERKTLR